MGVRGGGVWGGEHAHAHDAPVYAGEGSAQQRLSKRWWFEVWCLGFGVWGLGFGVWGLGFGTLCVGMSGLDLTTASSRAGSTEPVRLSWP